MPPSADLERLLDGSHHDPHSVLGVHSDHAGTTVARALRPGAKAVALVAGEHRFDMDEVADGLFATALDEPPGEYLIEVDYGGDPVLVEDPYRWLPTLGELDLHLFSEGRHERLWQVLGAHQHSYEVPGGVVAGTSFAVWAPNARGVRVTGDFDGWDGRANPMRSLGSSGVWELFVPGLPPGTRYKFRIFGQDGRWHERADPMAFATEVPPATASVVSTSDYLWRDEPWLEKRESTRWTDAPMSVYEVHLGS
ncbi:MAG TPA: 1,4-alpha-glucan branching enzyme, partial [Actinophytocola sp.]|uniref:GlgB N-terminal domain-containing protein n=1 Tax=Actinophytocola sp. TaxID=1872138 RepID=UPI002E09CF36|nr:1,4-alpha-glucan branching enzyme [Actinophytocola sp.]